MAKYHYQIPSERI